MSKTLTVTEIWQALEAVKDPEIPVVSVVEMGIVRDVIVSEERVIVKMTPTFSGCPALDVIRHEIAECVRQLGVADVQVETVLYPPWTTDWLSEETRPPQSVWPCPAAAAGRSYPSDALPAGLLPLLRFGRHGAEEQLWFHALPGHLLLPILPAAV